jgi:predicted  nucleic acid-binding Zn-ribbon protein
MGQANPYHGLELRLKLLENRIRTFKERTSRAEGLQKIEALGAISRLEGRYKQLKDRLDELSREGPGFRHRIRNQLEKLAFDLSGALESFITRADSRYRPDERPPQASKPSK